MVVVVGYSFNDAWLQETLVESMRRNPSAMIHVAQPRPDTIVDGLRAELRTKLRVCGSDVSWRAFAAAVLNLARGARDVPFVIRAGAKLDREYRRQLDASEPVGPLVLEGKPDEGTSATPERFALRA
jgi:hypothetical protein